MQILWRLKQRVDQNLRSWFSLPDFLSTGGKSFSLAVFLETRESVSLLGISSLCSLRGAPCSASMIRVRLEGEGILLALHSGKQGSEVRSQDRTGTLVHMYYKKYSSKLYLFNKCLSKQYCLTSTPPSNNNLTIICPTSACMSLWEHSCHCETSNYLGSPTVYSGLENRFTFSTKNITNQIFTAQEIFIRQVTSYYIRCSESLFSQSTY